MARVPPKCCWCGGKFVRIGEHYWCQTEACRTRQASCAVVARGSDGSHKFLFVPLPKQVEFEECGARNLLGGGGAGSTKSHIARWSLYRRAIRLKDYEALLLRETWDELKKHHFRLMEREQDILNAHGIPCTFSPTNREFKFHETGAVIEGGHMESAEDVKRYLGRERDDIAVDEGVQFHPQPLLELSTRARTSKLNVLEAGDARFRVYTNPGGRAASMLREFFIDKEPDWENYSEELRTEYNPADWHYIPGNVEDNPYLTERYQSDLAVLQPWRHRQLRYNDWDIVAGTFFAEFSKATHVKDLGDPGESVEWFHSLDWGYANPGCILWWACLPDGILYIRREHKFSHLLIEPFVHTVMEIDAELGVRSTNLRYSVADPALRGINPNKTTQEGVITGETMDETFANAGMPLLMGKNDRKQGWQRVHELLGDRKEDVSQPDLGPTIIIHPSCKYLIRCLADAVSAENDPEDVNMKDDHPLDSLRYGSMSRPSPTRIRKIYPHNSFMNRRAQMIRAKQRRMVR